MPLQGFLDIDIGDPTRYSAELAAYKLASNFLSAVGGQYGLNGEACDLGEDDTSTLMEAFAADPTWSSRGAASTVKPTPIRAGRIILDLFADEAPKAVENFRCLLTGERGIGKGSNKPLHYKGCAFHRIVHGFCCQGGDIVRGDGSGGDSIYGGKFNDEKGGQKRKHAAAGVLSMANGGKNTNTSQFFLTLGPAAQCDGKHVVLGCVSQGLEILERIDLEAASTDGKPRVLVTISDCGVL
ncbi:MAG: hypothetical protein WDW38_003066 [Sanguina aurantia]